jgi:hypothetical protein
VQELKGGDFSLQELMSAGYGLSALIGGGFTVEEMKGAGVTASRLKDAGCSVSKLVGSAFSSSELQAAGFSLAELFSIVAADADPAMLAQARLYYSDVEFASQLCREFAAAKRGDAELSSRLSQAHDALQLIVDHNPLLRSPPSGRQPAWPRHEALILFDLPLLRLTPQYMFTKKWISRFFVLRGSRLYYSNGKSGHPDSLEGSLAFMRSNPKPDGHYCLDLTGACTRCYTLRGRCLLLRISDALGCRLQRCAVQGGGRRAGVRLRNHVPCWAEGACIIFQHVRAHHTACCRLQRMCAWLPPMTRRARAACASSKPRAQAAPPPPCPTSHPRQP